MSRRPEAAPASGGAAAERLTYDAAYAGASVAPADRWPPGYGRLRVRIRLGSGEELYAAAARAVLEWRMHRAMGVVMDAEHGARHAAPGVRVTVGLGAGPLRVRGPCRVVWADRGERRAGWAYGTLPGHPVSGEEAFVVVREADGTVWLDVRAFSRPAVWWVKAAAPLIPLFQRAYARRCGGALRRLARAGTGETGRTGRTRGRGRPEA